MFFTIWRCIWFQRHCSINLLHWYSSLALKISRVSASSSWYNFREFICCTIVWHSFASRKSLNSRFSNIQHGTHAQTCNTNLIFWKHTCNHDEEVVRELNNFFTRQLICMKKMKSVYLSEYFKLVTIILRNVERKRESQYFPNILRKMCAY